ncbi:MAG: DUF3253 domain-containing protein [Solirubrobacterales bacterium]
MESESAERDRARESILALLDARELGKTICPSEAARAIGGEEFHDLMPTVRSAAAELVEEGMIDVTQGGHVVDPGSARGPIRLRVRNG